MPSFAQPSARTKRNDSPPSTLCSYLGATAVRIMKATGLATVTVAAVAEEQEKQQQAEEAWALRRL